jgi:hypothetical protein
MGTTDTTINAHADEASAISTPGKKRPWVGITVRCAVVALCILGGLSFGAWLAGLPRQVDNLLLVAQKDLQKQYGVATRWHHWSLDLSGLFSPQLQAVASLHGVQASHPQLGLATVKQLDLALPLLPLLNRRPLAIKQLTLGQTSIRLAPNWQQYQWPKITASPANPLQGATVLLDKGYDVLLPLSLTASPLTGSAKTPPPLACRGERLVWQGWDTPNSQLATASTLTMAGHTLPVEIGALFNRFAPAGVRVKGLPGQLMASALPVELKRLLIKGNAKSLSLPAWQAEWTPQQWKLQTLPTPNPVVTLMLNQTTQGFTGLGLNSLGLSGLKAVGHTTQNNHTLWLDAAELTGALRPDVSSAATGKASRKKPQVTPAQKVVVLANGKLEWTKNTITAQTLLPRLTLKGHDAKIGPWQSQLTVSSQWKGALKAVTGIHFVTVDKVTSRYGQQKARLRLLTQGGVWQGGLIDQLQGQLLGSPLSGRGEITPQGFKGLLMLDRLTLTPAVLANLSVPSAYRSARGQVSVALQSVQWRQPQQTLVGRLEARQLVLPNLPAIKHAMAVFNGRVITVPNADLALSQGTATVAGRIIQQGYQQGYHQGTRQSRLRGRYALRPLPAQIQAQLQLGQVPVPVLMQTLRPWLDASTRAALPAHLSGQVDGVVMLNGPVTQPHYQGVVNFTHVSGQLQKDLRASQLTGRLQFKDPQWQVTLAGGQFQQRGFNPIAVQAQLAGIGNQLTQTQGNTVKPLALAQWGVPVDAGTAALSLTKSGTRWQMTANIANASTSIQGQPAVFNGEIHAHLPVNARNMNNLWVYANNAQLQWQNVPVDLSFAGHPFARQGVSLTTHLPTKDLWAYPALQGILGPMPPYTHLASTWQVSAHQVALKQLDLQHATQTQLPDQLALSPYLQFQLHPQQADHWLQWAVHTPPDGLPLAEWAPYLNPQYFSGLKGALKGDMAFDLGLISQANGQLAVNNLELPALKVNPLQAVLTLSGTEGKLQVDQINIPGVKATQLSAELPRWNDWPIRLHNADLHGERFDITRFQRYVDEVVMAEVTKGMLAPLIGPWKPGMLVLPFELYAPQSHFDEVIYQNILLHQVSGDLAVLASSYTSFKNAELSAASGKITGQLSLDPLANNFLSMTIDADHVQANALAKALLNVPNQIFGSMTGSIRFTTSGQTDLEALNNTNGTAVFNIRDGRVPALSKVETLLTGANVIRTGVLGLSLNNLARLIWPFDVNNFNKLSSSVAFTNGKLYANDPFFMASESKNLRLKAQGSIGLADGYSDMIIHGKMRQNVQGTFGKLGQWSLLYLLGHVPGINLGGRNLLGYIPGIGFVPGFGGPAKGSKNDFTLRVIGPFGDPKAIKDFRWGKQTPGASAVDAKSSAEVNTAAP